MITTDNAKMSLAQRIAAGLKKTRRNLVGLFTGAGISEDFYEELEEALIASDAGLTATAALIAELREKVAFGGVKTDTEAREVLVELIRAHLAPMQKAFALREKAPTVVMLAGVNGAGKTTTIGKLTHLFASRGLSVVLGAADTFRAAAREQLGLWAERAGVDIVQGATDPAAAAFEAVRAGVDKNADVVIVDTAGRLSTQSRLMQELARIRRVQEKALEGAPHEVVLVIDGTNGQNALNQVSAFDAVCPLTGLVITKLDGSAKGGAVLALAFARRDNPVAVYFVGVGEKAEDLMPFDAQAFARALLAD